MREHPARAEPGGAGRPVPAGLGEYVLAGSTLAYGVALGRLIPQKWHVPANVTAALVAVAAARRSGASAADCGLSRQAAGRGVRGGTAAAGVIAAVVASGSLADRTRRLFLQEQIAGHDGARALYEVLVRIPVGTALAEEVLFRGALLGVMLRRHPAGLAVALSSLCFGVWHVTPTMASLRSAAVGRAAHGRAGAPAAVAGVVGMTTAAGAGFAALRLRSGSVLAPAVAHAALNATAYLVARLAGRSGSAPA